MDFLAALEQDQSGNGGDSEAVGQMRFVFGIHFDHRQFAFPLLGQILEDRGHGVTGAAPLRPEIREDGKWMGLQEGIEFGRQGLFLRLRHGFTFADSYPDLRPDLFP